MPDVIRRFFDLDVDRLLLVSKGEYVIDEVPKHWSRACATGSRYGCCGAAVRLHDFRAEAVGDRLPHGSRRSDVGSALLSSRSHGPFRRCRYASVPSARVFDQHLTTMPITRNLDVSVHQLFPGRLLGYGHFVFEPTAQDQGLQEIDYVDNPEERGLTIQRVIQMAGYRTQSSQTQEMSMRCDIVPTARDDVVLGRQSLRA